MFIKRGDGKILNVINSPEEGVDNEISPELEAFAKDQFDRAKKAIMPAGTTRPATIKRPNTEK